MASDFEAFEAQLRETNDKINARSGRPLVAAILTGLVLGAAVIASILVPWLIVPVGGALIGFTAYELASALRASGRRIPRVPLVIVSVAVVPLTFFFGTTGLWLGLLGACALMIVWRLFETLNPRFRASGAVLARDLGASLLVLGYVTFLSNFAILLMAQPGGNWWTLAFLAVIVAVDTAAYGVGLTLGRHPMAPSISPKKSWEGFAGGAAVALIAGVLLGLFVLRIEWWQGLLFGAALLVAGTVGDLVESLVKRELGVKDISAWLPGHGGFLDRLDSVIPSAVVAYGLYVLFT